MALKHSMYVLTRHLSNDNPIPFKWLVDSTCKHSRCFFLCLPQQPSLGALKEKLEFAIIITTIKGKIKPERILFMCVVFNVYFARYWTYDICYHLVQPKDVFAIQESIACLRFSHPLRCFFFKIRFREPLRKCARAFRAGWFPTELKYPVSQRTDTPLFIMVEALWLMSITRKTLMLYFVEGLAFFVKTPRAAPSVFWIQKSIPRAGFSTQPSIPRLKPISHHG